jgi:hypothetical protein
MATGAKLTAGMSVVFQTEVARRRDSICRKI